MFKMLIAALVLALPFASHAQTLQSYAGNYGDMAVTVNASTGKLSLIDRDARVIYTANVKTGQEVRLDHTFLYFSRDPQVLQYAEYIKYITVAGQFNSAGEINWVLKAHVGFDSEEVQAVVVFHATSKIASETIDFGYGYRYTMNGIRSNLMMSHIEAPSGDSSANVSTAYRFALNMILKLFPSQGIVSWLYNWSY